MALQMEVDSLELKIESEAQEAAENVRELGDALAYVKAICKGGLGLASVANALEKINKFSNTNLKIDVDAGKTKELADKLKDVTTESKKSEDALKDVTEQTKTFGTTTESVNLRSLVKGFVALRRIVQPLKKIVKEATDYVETINLAQVAMKDYFGEAEAYANRVNDKLGVDPAIWLKEQAMFMAMATGFGFTEDKAYKLSKALTELSYDISSLYNEDINKASLRLQSALAGEIEPIRRLGISISQATLEEFALAKGITESVSAMTEQEKSLLRTLKLIEDSSKIGAVGDLARTIEQPANAMRVLTQQFRQLKRTIGTTFIPLLINVIPYLQAATELLTDIVSRVATLVGFEMPEWDADSWNGLENGADGVTGSIEEATEAAKELKRQTAGFDELNVLSANDGSGISADGGTSSWVNDLEIPSLWDDTVLDQIADKTTEIKENLKPMVEGALAFGAALLLLKIPDAFNTAFGKLYNLFTNKTFTTAVSVGLAIQGIKWSVDAGAELSQGDIDKGVKEALTGAVSAGIAGAITFGPMGAIVGTFGSLAITFTSFVLESNKAADRAAVERYEKYLSGLIDGVRETVKTAAEEALEIKINLKAISGDISAEDAAKFELAKSYVDKLYGLVDDYNEDPTNQTVLENIETTISDINGLSLENLQLAFDGVGGVVTALDGTILQTKSDALEMIKAVEDQAKLTALATAKAQAEIEGAKAKAAYDNAAGSYAEQRTVLQGELEKYSKLIEETQKEINSYYVGTGNPLKFLAPNKLNEYITLKDMLSGYQTKLKAVESALEDADNQFAPIMDAYKEASNTIEHFDTEWQKLSAEINGVDFDPAAKAVTDFTKKMNTDFASLSSAVKEVNEEIKTFFSDAKKALYDGGLGQMLNGYGRPGGRFAVTVSAYADGGFPTMGDLFIANEEAPEFVGTLGGRTAVANNDQIVAGIANGVASANAAQNALLREQNNILLAILQKTGIVTLDGKTLDHSIEQYRSNKGASIMSGGVR